MKIRDRIKELRRVSASSLRPNPKNWRTHPKEQADALRGTLAEIGFAEAVVARELPDGSLELIDGHLRAETVGDAEVPVLVLDVTEDEADKLLVTLDPLAAMATVDADALASLVATVETDSDALRQMIDDLATDAGIEVEPEIVEDEVPEVPVDPITKPGDLWLLGDHRLLCGDSTKAEDVERLMGGEKAGMMVTDPPYGVNYDPEMRETAKSIGKIANDDRASWREAWDLYGGDVAYVWHASMFTHVVLADLEAVGLRHVSMIIWKKPYATFSRANYHWQHEPCWYCVRPSGSRNWVGSPKESTVWDMTQPKDPYGRSGEDNTPHPTQKPVEAMARPMRNHDHSLVYDPFLGSGTTLIAAEQLGRRCFGMEISPAYCDVIVKRWETLTGRKATLAT